MASQPFPAFASEDRRTKVRKKMAALRKNPAYAKAVGQKTTGSDDDDDDEDDEDDDEDDEDEEEED